MSKPKQKNPKIKIEQLKKPKKNMFRVPLPVNGFVFLDDPDYLLDELPVDAVLELRILE